MIAPKITDGPGFRIAFEARDGFLRAYVHDGVDSVEVSIAMWRLIAAECHARKATRLLVLEDLAGTVAPEDVPEVIAAVAAAGLDDVRVAFVELQGHQQGNEQGEILLLEQGFPIYLAHSESAARHWLLYGD